MRDRNTQISQGSMTTISEIIGVRFARRLQFTKRELRGLSLRVVAFLSLCPIGETSID